MKNSLQPFVTERVERERSKRRTEVLVEYCVMCGSVYLWPFWLIWSVTTYNEKKFNLIKTNKEHLKFKQLL